MCQCQDQTQEKRELTIYNNVLTILLVPLPLNTNLVSEAVALVAEGLTFLEHWGPCCQLSLSTGVQ